jgi:signal peptidase II
MNQSARRLPDVRVGSSPDGLAPVSVAERSLSAGARQWAALMLVALTAVAADQLTKHLVASQLDLGEEVAVLGPFSIHHVHNSGIAFGLFASATAIVIFLTGLAVLWMLAFFARSGSRHPVLPVGLGLVIGGSLSNLVDRIRLGHVTDFLDLTFWPAFNLADSFIVVGVIVLVGALVVPDRPGRPSPRP